MSDDRSKQWALDAIARHRAALDAASARLNRAASSADRMAALRGIERSMATLGRLIGESRRLAALGCAANPS